MLTKDVLRLDPVVAAAEIEEAIRAQVLGTLKRRGVVVGVSGGIDSSVTAALCARALGGNRVQALLMPERDSSDASLELGRSLGERFGIPTLVENIGPVVAAAGCYERQDEAIRMVFPDYEPGWRFKVTLPSILEGDRINVSELTVQSPQGARHTARVPLKPYLQLIAATNFKQRIRKMMEYYHADRLNYAVAGTPNRLEYDQGFFVKNGDGAADVKPIAHLYKSQVYGMARHLGLPERVCAAVPTTDTYSLAQGQDEFYFALPYRSMDLALWALNHQVPAAELARVLGIGVAEAEAVYADIEAKRRTTRYLHLAPVLAGDVPELDLHP